MRTSKFACNLFEDDIEGLSYFAGFVYADGHVNKERSRVQFLSSDSQIIEDLSRRMDYSRPMTVQESKLGYKTIYSNILFSDNAMFFKNLGFFPDKDDWSLEDFTFEVDVYHFIRGVLDGDGHISTYKSSKGETLLNGLYIIFRRKMAESVLRALGVGRIQNAKKPDRVKDIVYLTFGGRVGYQISNLIWEKSSIHLQRKYNQYLTYREHGIKVISSIR